MQKLTKTDEYYLQIADAACVSLRVIYGNFT